MNISFEGIGEWCATFGCGAGVSVDASKGREYLILSVDSTEKTAVIKL